MRSKLLIWTLTLVFFLPVTVLSQLSFDPELIDVTLEPDLEFETMFEVTNDGESAVDFWITKTLTGERYIEPWTELGSDNAEEIIGDDELGGVVFIDGNYYIAGGNNGDEGNFIYVFDINGDSVDVFEQPDQESNAGINDLAWDGEVIWAGAGGSRTVYGFDTSGEVIYEWEGPRNPNQALAWDPDQGLLWIRPTNQNLYAYDRDGEQIYDLNVDRVDTKGLGYYPEDVDGYNLYIFSDNDETETRRQILKVNIQEEHEDMGEIMEVGELEFEDESRASALQITRDFDPHHWMFLGLLHRSDWVVGWELNGYLNWLNVEPNEGSIGAGETAEFTVMLNSADVPDDAFEGELIFNYGDEMEGYAVTMTVSFDRIETHRVMDFHSGWNIVSLNIQPDETDVEVLFSDFVDADNLILMKNGYGDYYSPMFEFNNIEGWDVEEGYMIKLNRPADLRFDGMSVLQDDPIALEEGWQLASYYPRRDIEATLALSGIEEVLEIAKDGMGRFYAPDWSFSNMGDLSEGNGYFLKVSEDVELTYRWEREADIEGIASAKSVYDSPGLLPVHPNTGNNMSLLVNAGNLTGEIGVYTNDVLVGSGVIENGLTGIAVWGDDPTTSEIDGAVEGAELEIKLLDGGGLQNVDYEIVTGGLYYSANGFTVIEVSEIVSPIEFGLISSYPNPFNSSTRISYNLPEATDVSINVFDLNGRLVTELVNGRTEAGIHASVLQADLMPSGLYIVRLDAGSRTSQMKVTLVK